ncbi:MAG: hypothetical protein ABSF64_35985 [Bryobacteraceae bacterium]
MSIWNQPGQEPPEQAGPKYTQIEYSVSCPSVLTRVSYKPAGPEKMLSNWGLLSSCRQPGQVLATAVALPAQTFTGLSSFDGTNGAAKLHQFG